MLKILFPDNFLNKIRTKCASEKCLTFNIKKRCRKYILYNININIDTICIDIFMHVTYRLKIVQRTNM